MKVAEPLPFVGRLKIAVDDATDFVLSFERSIEAFAPQCRIQGILPADVVNDYLLDGFVAFCRALDCMRSGDSDGAAFRHAKRLERAFMRIDSIVGRNWKRFKKTPRRSFRRAALIMGSVFKPDAFSAAKIPSAMRGKMSFETYRRCVIDRVAEAVRDPLIWLRDESRVLESTLA